MLSTSDTAQGISEMVPLPNGLATIAPTNKGLDVDGCFFPDKLIALVTDLCLANPGEDSQENERKLTKVQTLYKEGMSFSLQIR